MADNFADWYTGNMAPPLALPGGGYIPAPSSTPQMSVDEMYRGMYGPAPQSQPSGGLTTRTVKTVDIDPSTGMPTATLAKLLMNGQANAALGAIAEAAGGAQVAAPNQPAGSINAYKAQDRLPSSPPGMRLGGGMLSASASGGLGAGVGSGGSLTANSMQPTHVLNVQPTDEEGQYYADNLGMPVQTPNGRIYTPKVAYTPEEYIAAKDMARQPQQQPQRGGLLGGLLGGLFGGNQRPGGMLGGLFQPQGNSPRQSLVQALVGGNGSGGGTQYYGSSPSQGLGMTVDPNTSTGSALESLGYASGSAVPAAAIRSLSAHGYI